MKKTLLLSSLLCWAGSSWIQAQDKPVITQPNDTTWYCLYTPERQSLHITDHGPGQELTGETSTWNDDQLWCFLEAADGHYLIQNRKTKAYLGERILSGQKYYRSSSEKPQTGISLEWVSAKKLFNLKDADAHLINQCDDTQKRKLTNWDHPTDPGNLFAFKQVDVTHMALSKIKMEAERLLDQTESGDVPGTYPEKARQALQQVISQAQTTEEVAAAMETYKKQCNTVREGVWYYLVSSGPGYCKNRVIYNTKQTAGAYLRWGDKTIDENAFWEFVPTGDPKQGLYLLRNKASGLYLQATSKNNDAGEVRGMASSDNNTRFQVSFLNQDRSFLIKPVNGNPIHAQNDFGVMVTWNATNYGSASSWKIVPATEAELKQAAEKTETDAQNYKMVWQEEFNGEGPVNQADWNFEQGFMRNYEDQWYQSDNAYQKDGNLVIEARQERKKNPWYEAGSKDWKKSREYIEYTSSSLTTAGKHDFLYGRVEVRAKIPCYSGSWPAIWMLGYEDIAGEWPSSGEIDIMEYYKDKTLANLVWGSSQRWQGIWESRSTPVTGYWMKQDPEWSSKYHIWRMDWDKESIKLYLDDELITICNLSRTINQGQWHKAENPFHTNQYLLLNLAMGGQNGGNIDKSKLPFSYLVDYVRVYQKSDQITGISHPGTDDGSPLVYQTPYSCNINTRSFQGTTCASLYSLTGSLVTHTEGEASQGSLPMSLQGIPAGVYLVHVTDGEKQLSEKIIVP